MSAYTDLLNKRARMTPAERSADILKEAMGPIFGSFFPSKTADRLPYGCDGCEERIDGSRVCCQDGGACETGEYPNAGVLW